MFRASSPRFAACYVLQHAKFCSIHVLQHAKANNSRTMDTGHHPTTSERQLWHANTIIVCPCTLGGHLHTTWDTLHVTNVMQVDISEPAHIQLCLFLFLVSQGDCFVGILNLYNAIIIVCALRTEFPTDLITCSSFHLAVMWISHSGHISGCFMKSTKADAIIKSCSSPTCHQILEYLFQCSWVKLVLGSSLMRSKCRKV